MTHRTVEEPHIQPLHETDEYRVAQGEPDVRAWTVVTADGTLVGEVDDVLVDVDALRICYVDIALDQSLRAHGQRERHIVVPVEVADLDRSNRILRLQGLTVPAIASLPTFSHERITREFEESLRPHFGAISSRPLEGERFRTADDEMSIGRRRAAAGAAHVQKRVETEHVREAVPVSHEEVVIERRPLSRGNSTADRGPDEIRVPPTKK